MTVSMLQTSTSTDVNMNLIILIFIVCEWFRHECKQESRFIFTIKCEKVLGQEKTSCSCSLLSDFYYYIATHILLAIKQNKSICIRNYFSLLLRRVDSEAISTGIWIRQEVLDSQTHRIRHNNYFNPYPSSYHKHITLFWQIIQLKSSDSNCSCFSFAASNEPLSFVNTIFWTVAISNITETRWTLKRRYTSILK